MKIKNKFQITYLFLSVCILAPFSIDIFISGLPSIATHFNTSHVGLVLGMSLLGLTICQPIYGPLMDRFGRKPIILAGLVVFTVFSYFIMIATTFSQLVVFRFFQAVGGCAGVIGAMTIIKDLYPKEMILSKIGLVMAMIGISPVIAPFVGSLLNASWGWRASFYFLFILGLIYLLFFLFFFKESISRKHDARLKIADVFSGYIQLCRNNKLLAYCLTSGLTYSILFSYLNISAFLIINNYGFHQISYGSIISLNAIIIFLMANLAPKISKKRGVKTTTFIGLSLMAIGGASMFIVNSIMPSNIYIFMLPMLITTFGTGIIRPTASGGAMLLAPKTLAGYTAGLFNSISFGVGALVSIFSVKFIHTASFFGGFILLFSILALLVMILLYKDKETNVQE